MGFQDFWKVFQLNYVLNASTIILGILWVLLFIWGYKLIAGQVKLVKKEIWNWKETLKCSVFGFFFASGVIIILAITETVVLKSQKLPYEHQAPYILIPMFFCLIFISLYPLFELILMARNKQKISVTPFQRFFESPIKKFSAPLSYLVAIGLYILFFIIPVFILTGVLHIELIIVWVSWVLLLPMLIVSYYASIGYVVGVATEYGKMPNMQRSTLLAFDRSKRAEQEFWQEPIDRIVFVVLVFIYFVLILNVYHTFERLWWVYISDRYSRLAINTDWILPISLIFAISAFFTRYWNRKVKISTQSIFFSAYLIAAVGINVLVNFTIARPEIFTDVFLEWDFTRDLYNPLYSSITNWTVPIENVMLNYSLFNIIGETEELVISLMATYYFFLEPNRKFIFDTIRASAKSLVEKFKPITAFNLTGYKSPTNRAYGKEVLIQMYDRIPIKKLDYEDPTVKSPLFDALCDPTNFYTQAAAKEILGVIVWHYPEMIKGPITEALQSSNFLKVRNTCDVIFESGNLSKKKKLEEHSSKNIISLLPKSILFQLLVHKDYVVRISGAKLIKMFYLDSDGHEKPTEKEVNQLQQSLEDPETQVEMICLEILSKYPDLISKDIFTSRLNHSNPQIQSIVASSVGNIGLNNIASASVEDLITLMESSNPDLQANAMLALGKIANLKENQIPIEPFKDGLFNQNKKIRNAAMIALSEFLQENSKLIKSEFLLKQLESISDEMKDNVLKLLGMVWQQDPSKVLPVLISYLYSDNNDLKILAQETLILMGKKNPKKITNKLIVQPETESFIKIGKIAETILKISDGAEKKVLKIALSKCSDPENNTRINASTILKVLAKKNSEIIPLDEIVEYWVQEKNQKIKKNFAKVVTLIGKYDSEGIKPFIPQIIQVFKQSEDSVRVTIAKLLVDLAKSSPALFSQDIYSNFSKDSTSVVREQGMLFLGAIGVNSPENVISFLLKGLNDDEWSVKNAAAEALAHVTAVSPNKKVIKEMQKLLQSKNKWSRKTALDIFIEISKKNSTALNLDVALNLMVKEEKDEALLGSLAKLIGNLALQNFDQAFKGLIQMMENSSDKVRNNAINAMVTLSRGMDVHKLVPKLLFYLSEETNIVLQESVAKSLQRIVKYESKELKNRCISLLRIRASTSQNKILNEVLNSLEK
ncbi:MAG: HEAT repeat domain-containing protein [Promethearchaeota archaeon]